MDKQRSRRRRELETYSILSYSSPDVTNLWAWLPPEPSAVYILLELEIGNRDGSDLFFTTVATPEALAARARGKLVVQDRALIVVAEYRWEAIVSHLDALVERLTRAAPDWPTAVGILQRHFTWEYE